MATTDEICTIIPAKIWPIRSINRTRAIGYITLDPSGGTNDLDIVRYSINNLCDLRDDIKDNTDYVIKDIIQDVVK